MKLAFGLMALGCWVGASTMSTDGLTVGTIVGGAAQGVVVSSPVVFSAGASLILQGPDGYLTSLSSITASAFFGDASHLTELNANTFSSTNTWLSLETFNSTFTVRSGGRAITISANPPTSNFLISPNGAVTFNPELHNVAFAQLSTWSTGNSRFSDCVSGSTLTITTSGGRVEVGFVGFVATQSTGNASVGINFLQDGRFVNDLSANKGIFFNRIENNRINSEAFSYLLDAPSSGSHSYCLTIAGEANVLGDPNGAILQNTSGITDLVGQRNIFFVEEIK